MTKNLDYSWLLSLQAKAAKKIKPRRNVSSRGVTFNLSVENWITQYRWHSFESKEPETLNWIDGSFDNGDVFFDIGSNVGLYAIYAALKHPTSTVIAIECEYSNLHLLKENILENNLSKRIIPFSFALGEKEEISYLNVQDLTPGAAMHSVSTEEIERTYEDQRVVWREGTAKITLDFFCEKTGITPNCIKIDVDGGEYDILKGGVSTFRDPNLRTLLIEISRDSEHYVGCEAFLMNCGFHLLSEVPERSNQVWGRG